MPMSCSTSKSLQKTLIMCHHDNRKKAIEIENFSKSWQVSASIKYICCGILWKISQKDYKCLHL